MICKTICLLAFLATVSLSQSFDEIKFQIAKYESNHGKYRLNKNKNKNGTVDLGIYQINSRNLQQSSDTLCVIFNHIFKRYKIGKKTADRIRATQMNDSLNEDLARALYNLRGIKQWTSSYKFMVGK